MPAITDDDKKHIIEQLCHGAVSYKDIKEREVKPVVMSWLSHAQRELLDKHAPERLSLPNGRTPKVAYENGKSPFISLRIQELYDVNQTPKIALGRVPVTVHILTPGMKPIQVTQDLANFWREHYPKIKSELAAEISETFLAMKSKIVIPSPRQMGRGNARTSTVDQLCPNCGLCCNGVLFADVELQPGDDAGRLIDLGMSLKKKGMKRAFVQPCRCFDGKLCRIYADRPKRCAAFECGLLKRVQVGEMSAPAALKRIADAKKLVEKVRRLLHRLGDKDEQLALTKRYSRMMAKPIDLAVDEDTGEARGELMLAVNDLMHVLQRDFLK